MSEVSKEKTLQPVRAVQDGSCHWYVIPESLADNFRKDVNSDDLEGFYEKYEKYLTGGDLNNIQLYAAI